ncbi:MAG: hypothetical protein KAG28_00305 [Cocleimonas sp.]|nr:hypothetical protein [Cocleimonas sp.]
MKSIQAIVTGTFFILICNLLLQLLFLFVIVEYHTLSKEIPSLQGMGVYARYLLAIPAFIIIMFIGGMITASILETRWLLHCSIVGVISFIAMITPLLSANDLTLTGATVSVLSFLAVIAGGWYWQRRSIAKRVQK